MKRVNTSKTDFLVESNYGCAGSVVTVVFSLDHSWLSVHLHSHPSCIQMVCFWRCWPNGVLNVQYCVLSSCGLICQNPRCIQFTKERCISHFTNYVIPSWNLVMLSLDVGIKVFWNYAHTKVTSLYPNTYQWVHLIRGLLNFLHYSEWCYLVECLLQLVS